MGNNVLPCTKIYHTLLENKWMILNSVLDFLKVVKTLVKVTLVAHWAAITMVKLLQLELLVGVKDALSLAIQGFMEESLRFWIGSSQTWDVEQQAQPLPLLPLPQLLNVQFQVGREMVTAMMQTIMLNAITMEEIAVEVMSMTPFVKFANVWILTLLPHFHQ